MGSFWTFSQHIMGYDPSKKAWVMGYQRVMGYPPCPNSGRAKKYGVSEVMGYQKVWVMGNSTVVSKIGRQQSANLKGGCLM